MEGHSTVEDQRPRNSYHRVCYVFVAQLHKQLPHVIGIGPQWATTNVRQKATYVVWIDMTSAERMEPTGESSPNLNRTDPLPYPSPCKNSSDLYQFQERPLAKVGWICPPQSTPWRRHCLFTIAADELNATIRYEMLFRRALESRHLPHGDDN